MRETFQGRRGDALYPVDEYEEEIVKTVKRFIWMAAVFGAGFLLGYFFL